MTNQNQGGGEKKAGFPYQVGRGSQSSVILGHKRTNLSMIMKTALKTPPNQNLPIGFSGHHFHMR